MVTYELTSKKVQGTLLLSYDGGFLKSFEINFKDHLTGGKFAFLVSHLPYEQQYINCLSEIGFEIQETLKDNEKIAMFCRIYEQYIGLKYKVTAADSGKIKKVKVWEDLLHRYFKSERFEFKGKQSISNMVKYYNELLRDYANQGKSGNNFPNKYDREFEKTLDPKTSSLYYAHLRSLGLKPKRDNMMNIIDWE